MREGCNGIAAEPNVGRVRGRVAIGAAVLAIGPAACGGADAPTRAEYLAQVNELCRRYETRLQRVPVPANFADPRLVEQSFAEALPLVERRVEEIRALAAPEAMRAQVTRVLNAADATTREMRLSLIHI